MTLNALSSSISRDLHNPVIASLLENRTTGVIIVGGAVLHGALVVLGLPSWQCPIRHGLGIPCPGCGLSRAMAALLHGDWRTSFTYHAFAPLFLAAFVLMAVVTVLPSPQRQAAINRIGLVERRTKITTVLLIVFVLYWLARLVFYREAFINLIMG